MKTAPYLATAFLIVGSMAHAQSTPPAQAGTNAGQQIATAGTPNGATACIGCHGAKGEGNPAAAFPSLAGQPQDYLERQLKSYAEGGRKNPVMEPIAKGLNEQQMQAVSRYYSELDPIAAKAPAPSAEARKRAQQLANVGDNSIGVQSCANCHGADGVGEPPVFPYLAGQHSSYLSAALKEWKSGARNTDPSMQMSMIGKRLSDADIAALSAYYAALPPPAVAAARQVSIPGRPGPNTGNQAGTAPTTGVGSEQGSATAGGNQGPGGGGGASGGGRSGSPTGESK